LLLLLRRWFTDVCSVLCFTHVLVLSLHERIALTMVLIVVGRSSVCHAIRNRRDWNAVAAVMLLNFASVLQGVKSPYV